MKKRLCLLLIFFCCFYTINLYSMNFMLGAKSGYYVWEPMLSELEGGGLEQIDKGDGLLYGPVASLMINDDLSLSLSLLTGKQKKSFSERNNYKTWMDTGEFTSTFNVVFNRTDIDTALSYRLMKGVKLIAGYKYQMVEMDFDATFINIDHDKAAYVQETMEFPAHGPALGVGYSHAFSETYFIAANLTFVYMWGKWKWTNFEQDEYEPNGTDLELQPSNPMNMGSYKTKQYGMNFEPTLGAKILDDMIVTLGFRFQWMKMDFVDKFDPGGNDISPDKPLNDYIYGVFVSAIYMF